MSDMLQIAQSGAKAYSRALEVVADNVANAGTPGYVRRTSTIESVMAGSGASALQRDPVTGNGVRMIAVGRATDALQSETLRRAEGDVSALDASSRWLRSTQSLLTGASAIDQSYASFTDSLSDMATDPTNLSLRQIFLLRGEALVERFNATAGDLANLQTDIRSEAESEAASLTALASDLAKLNGQIRRASNGSAAQASLMDQQDRLLAHLSTITAIDVQYDQMGQVKIRIPDSGGPLLVEGNQSQYARIEANGAGFELRIGPKGSDEMAPVTAGVLAGLASAAQDVAAAQTRLDDLATRLADDFNSVHTQGVDLDGNDGKPLFSTSLPIVTGDAGNAGEARLSASLAPGATLQDGRLIFDGTDWTFTNEAGHSTTGPLPLTLDGMTVTAAAGGRAGDVYRVSAASPAAALSLNAMAPEEVALSARWLTDAAQTNGGHATLALKLDDTAANSGTPPFTVNVLADGSAALYDSADPTTPIATAAAGDWLQGDGFAVRLDGSANPGDSFRIERAAVAEGNNANAQSLLALRERNGSAGSFADGLDALRSGITTRLAESNNQLELATARRDGAAEALQEKLGVDLNVEAAEMLRLQQAFQANARVIQASREIFDSILNATR